LDEVQAWPALAKRPVAAADAVAVTSASPSTMRGSDPPSSRTHFLRFSPACRPTASPAFSDPVSETPRIAGCAMTRPSCPLVAPLVAKRFW